MHPKLRCDATGLRLLGRPLLPIEVEGGSLKIVCGLGLYLGRIPSFLRMAFARAAESFTQTALPTSLYFPVSDPDMNWYVMGKDIRVATSLMVGLLYLLSPSGNNYHPTF